MDYPELGSIVDPINSYFERVSATDIRSCGIQPERLIFQYRVRPDREEKFKGLVRQLMKTVDSFEFRSPLYVTVSRSAKLDEDELSWGDWVLQFQVNDFGRQEEEYTNQLYSQAERLVVEIEDYLYATKA